MFVYEIKVHLRYYVHITYINDKLVHFHLWVGLISDIAKINSYNSFYAVVPSKLGRIIKQTDWYIDRQIGTYVRAGHFHLFLPYIIYTEILPFPSYFIVKKNLNTAAAWMLEIICGWQSFKKMSEAIIFNWRFLKIFYTKYLLLSS